MPLWPCPLVMQVLYKNIKISVISIHSVLKYCIQIIKYCVHVLLTLYLLINYFSYICKDKNEWSFEETSALVQFVALYHVNQEGSSKEWPTHKNSVT